MRLDNLPEYPIRPARPRPSSLRRPPSFGRFVASFVAGLLIFGLLLHAVVGSGKTRVVTSDRLPGGVLPGERLGFAGGSASATSVTGSASVTGSTGTASPTGSTDSTADPNTPGSLPPTVPPDEARAADGNTFSGSGAVAAANANVVSPAASNSSSGNKAAKTTAAPVSKSTPKQAATTTAKPKAAPAPQTAAPTTEKPKPKPKPTAPPTTAKPKPTTTTTTAPVSWNPDDVKALIEQMWPADSLDHALAIAWRESRYRNDVYNGWCCYGVFQINASAHQARLRARGLTTAALYDPRVNIEIALEIFREQGWGPWGG